MMKKFTFAVAGLAMLGIAGSAIGASHADPAIAGAIKARKAVMQLYAYNLGQLGAMAKGAVEYDAGVAGTAAANLAALTKLDNSTMWPKGSDEMSASDTRAKVAMWENMGDVIAKATMMQEAADKMAGAAGTDLASLQAAIGGVGGACGACHKAYRAPAN